MRTDTDSIVRSSKLCVRFAWTVVIHWSCAYADATNNSLLAHADLPSLLREPSNE